MPRFMIPAIIWLALSVSACVASDSSTIQPSSEPENTTVATFPTFTAPSVTPAISPTSATPTITVAIETRTPGVAESPPALGVRRISDGFDSPVYVTHAGDGSARLFVVEKPGVIKLLRDGQLQSQPFLDISDRVNASSSEQGLLSVAFHPQFAANGLLFVNYTDRDGNTVISRFQAQGDQADPGSEAILLQIEQPYANHNGGLNLFGPDGLLYIGMGDGGSAGDPQGNAQNPESLLGKLLRIDVDQGQPYAIPPDNPYVNSGGRPEIWVSGLRNPWRYSFDRATGDLFIADVGQGEWEEVNWLPAGQAAGANLGWNVMEGEVCYRDTSCDSTGFVAPINVYSHDLGCSVTGGYVYRGSQLPNLYGIYVFGDYCSGNLWTLHQAADGKWERSEPFKTTLNISSFGEDEAGELYLTDLTGSLYQLTTDETASP